MLKELLVTKVVIVDELPIEQYHSISNWISETKELKLISNIKEHMLSPTILKNWFETSLTNATVYYGDEIIGIATLTTSEAILPSDTAELCHLVVKPKYRRLYNGSSMLLHLMANAKQMGYKRIIGRVVEENKKGHALLKFLNWRQIHNESFIKNDTLIWYEKKF